MFQGMDVFYTSTRTNQDGNGWKWVLVAHNPAARSCIVWNRSRCRTLSKVRWYLLAALPKRETFFFQRCIRAWVPWFGKSNHSPEIFFGGTMLHQLLVNWWFGARWCGSPLMKGIVRGYPDSNPKPKSPICHQYPYVSNSWLHPKHWVRKLLWCILSNSSEIFHISKNPRNLQQDPLNGPLNLSIYWL